MRPEDMLDLPPMAEKPPGLNYKLADISDPSRISVTKIRWNMRTTNWLAGFFEVTKKHHHLFPYTKTSIFLTSASSGTERSCHALLVSATSSKTVAASKPAPWHFFVGERNWGQGGFARPEVQQFAHWKWMVGKRGFPFGIYPYFQVQTVRSVSFRESNWRVIFFFGRMDEGTSLPFISIPDSTFRPFGRGNNPRFWGLGNHSCYHGKASWKSTLFQQEIHFNSSMLVHQSVAKNTIAYITAILLLMEEILHQLICSLSHYDTPQVVIAGFLPATVSQGLPYSPETTRKNRRNPTSPKKQYLSIFKVDFPM